MAQPQGWLRGHASHSSQPQRLRVPPSLTSLVPAAPRPLFALQWVTPGFSRAGLQPRESPHGEASPPPTAGTRVLPAWLDQCRRWCPRRLPSAQRPQALQSKAISHPPGIAARPQRCGGGGGTGNRDNGWRHPTRWHIRRRPWEQGGMKVGGFPGTAEAGIWCLRGRCWHHALLPPGACGAGSWSGEAEPHSCLHRGSPALPVPSARCPAPLHPPDRKCPSDHQEAKDPALENAVSFGPAPKEEGKRRPRRRWHRPRHRSQGARVRGSGGPRGHEKQKQQPLSPPLARVRLGSCSWLHQGRGGTPPPGTGNGRPWGWAQRSDRGCPGPWLLLRNPLCARARAALPCQRCCPPAPVLPPPALPPCASHSPSWCPAVPALGHARRTPSAMPCAGPREHRAEEGGRRLGAATSVLAARTAQEPSPPSLCQGKSRPHRHGAEVIAGYYTALLLNTDHFSSDKRSV